MSPRISGRAVTDEQVEEILLLSVLTGMTWADAAYAVLEDFDSADFTKSASLTLRLIQLKKKLDDIIKQAHSPHTLNSEQADDEKGRTGEPELLP